MATVITAGNATNGLSFTSDNTGSLDIKTGTGAGTTAISISSSQNAMFAANLSFNSGYGSAAVAYGCRAWVNFNGVTTATIRASGNVSSVTRNSTGDYTVNFTTAMPDVNYSGVVTAGDGATGASSINRYGNIGSYATGSCKAFTGLPGTSTMQDMTYVNIAIFR